MPTQRKNGELNKVLNEISEYLSDISNVENIINYYWRAGIYAEKLLNDEKIDPRFQEYGFKSEQIWAIQHQVYGHSVSNIAKTVDPQINKAVFWSNIAQNILWVITALSLFISLLIYFLAHRIKQRLIRIDQQIFH